LALLFDDAHGGMFGEIALIEHLPAAPLRLT